MSFALLHGSDPYGPSFGASTNNTKGSYIELEDSTAFDVDEALGVLLRLTADRRTLVDFAVGAAASESVILANLYATTGNDAGASAGVPYRVRVSIPASSRVAVRAQFNSVTGTSIHAVLYVIEGDGSGVSSPVTYGANTSATSGVSVDPGALADTKGAYAEITSATSQEHTRWAYGVARHNLFPTFGSWRMDIATGAAGNETVIVGDILLQQADIGDVILPGSQYFDVTVASGTRVAVRAQSSITNSTGRLLSVILIGMDAPTGGGGGGGAFAYAFMG